MTLYAYCLSDELAGRVPEDVTGVDGKGPRILEYEGIQVVVSEFEGAKVAVERENVFAHERVIQRVLGHVTPLPFRFGTLVTSKGLEEYVRGNRAQLIKSLEHVRDSLEMSVKIIWDAQSMRGEVGRRAEAARGRKVDESPAYGKGAAYLAARRREILGDDLLKERAEEIAAWLGQRIGEAAHDRNLEKRPSASLVVRAAFLVRRARLKGYQKRVDEARAERAHLRFLTSGPWPPYSFSNINP